MNSNGNKTFFIDALGCVSNKVDAARVEQFLKTNGWVQTQEIGEAALVILMTCGFTQVAEDYNLKRLEDMKNLKNADAQLIIGGCLTAINKQSVREKYEGFIFTPRTLDTLNDFLQAEIPIEDIPATTVESDNKAMKIIKISTGCMGHCSYCAIPFANGKTISRNIQEIICDMRKSIEEGYRKIKFVSEDVGAYGQEQGLSLPELLRDILQTDLEFELYLDNLNPNWLYRYKKELFDLLSSDKIAKSLYIPVQSGSDRILNLMRRNYTVSEVKEVFYDLIKTFPDVKISTDLLVGFPSESDEDFEATRSLLNDFQFNFVEFFTYEDRPRTQASKLYPKITNDVKESRRQNLFEDFLKQFLLANRITNIADLRTILEKRGKLPVNFNLAS